MKLSLQKNQHYTAKVKLSASESLFASNNAVAEKFIDIGFTDVIVSGSGKIREAKGLWSGESKEVELPKDVAEKISDVKQI